ncbi:MAG: hypothetical protein WBD48_12705, partial [Pseudolabrys sp.]
MPDSNRYRPTEGDVAAWLTRLEDRPLRALMDEAAGLRRHGHGNVISFSPKVFIPLTQLCRDACGYCAFAKPPRALERPYLTADDVL